VDNRSLDSDPLGTLAILYVLPIPRTRLLSAKLGSSTIDDGVCRESHDGYTRINGVHFLYQLAAIHPRQ